MLRFDITADRMIELVQGDLTAQTDLDALVNAANPGLMGGGGVDGAIHAAGGPAILNDCRKIIARIGRLEPGRAEATTAGRLAARHVIHTAGPVWRGGGDGEPEVLRSCYVQSIQKADSLRLRTLGFPSISTGIYGYPIEEAADVAVQAVAEALSGAQYVRLARFVLFDRRTFDAYEQAMTRFRDQRDPNRPNGGSA